MVLERILCLEPGFVLMEDVIKQKLEHIPDDQLEALVWAQECPQITHTATTNHTVLVESFRAILANDADVDEGAIGENLSSLLNHIRLLLVCCGHVLRRVGDVDALGWPILHISSLNTSIATCVLDGLRACKSFLPLTEKKAELTSCDLIDRLSEEVDMLFGQCFMLLKMYIDTVQRFFPPKADPEAPDSDVTEYSQVLDCLYDTVKLCKFDKTTTGLAWKSVTLLLSKYADPLVNLWPRSEELFLELSGITIDAMLAACAVQPETLASNTSDDTKENSPPDTDRADRDTSKTLSGRGIAAKGGAGAKDLANDDVTETPECIALLEHQLKVARFFFTAYFRLCKPPACAPLLVKVFNRLFTALVCVQMRMLSTTTPVARDVFIARMHKAVEQIVYHMCAHPTILELVLGFSASDCGKALYAQHAQEAKLAYVVMLSQLIVGMDALPNTTHDLFLDQEHGALSVLLSLWPDLYTQLSDCRTVGSSTTSTGLYTHVLTAVCAHSVTLLFNGDEETFEARMSWLETTLFTHVLNPSFAVRYLVHDWWVYLSRRWSSGTVLQHSRLLFQMALKLPRDHHVENEVTMLINRMMAAARDVDKRVFVKELAALARNCPDPVVVMSRLDVLSLSDSILELVPQQVVSKSADDGCKSRANTVEATVMIESRANILSHPTSPVERCRRLQAFLQPLSHAVDVLRVDYTTKKHSTSLRPETGGAVQYGAQVQDKKTSKQTEAQSGAEATTQTPAEDATEALFCQVCRLSGYVMDALPTEMLLNILDLLTTSLDTFCASKACKWALVRCLSKLHLANRDLGTSKKEILSHIAHLFRRMLVDTDWLVWHYAVEAFREFASFTLYEALVPRLLPEQSKDNVVDYINNTPYTPPAHPHHTTTASPLQPVHHTDTSSETNSNSHPPQLTPSRAKSTHTSTPRTYAHIKDRFRECLRIESARYGGKLLPTWVQEPIASLSELVVDDYPSEVPSISAPNSDGQEYTSALDSDNRSTKRARVDKQAGPQSPMVLDRCDDAIIDTDDALLDLDEVLQHLTQGLRKLNQTLSPTLRISTARKSQLVEVAQSIVSLCSEMNTQ